MPTLLLDNCVVNQLEEDTSLLSLLCEIKEFGHCDFAICYSTIEEFSAIPDKEKRTQVLMHIFSLEPKVVYDSVAVCGMSRVGTAVVSEGEVYEKILNEKGDNIRDAIVAETAVSNNYFLVTNDKKLYNSMKRNNYSVLNTDDLRNGKQLMSLSYPILDMEYQSGFVCYLDILGFGSFSNDSKHLETIKKLIINLQGAIRIHELNKLIGNITLFSDCIFFTVDISEMKEPLFVTSIIDFICLARDIIQNHVGTDIRAGLAFGQYVHLKTGEIYGPAVTQAVRLAEPKKQNDVLYAYLDTNPASIIVHQNVLNCPLNQFGELTELLKLLKLFSA